MWGGSSILQWAVRGHAEEGEHWLKVEIEIRLRLVRPNKMIKDKDLHKTMGGTFDRPAVAFVTMSSNPSNTASDIVAWMSMSTGRPCSSAHRRLSTPSGVDLVNIVDSEVGTDDPEMYDGTLCSLSSRLKGTRSETMGVLFSLELSLRFGVRSYNTP